MFCRRKVLNRSDVHRFVSKERKKRSALSVLICLKLPRQGGSLLNAGIGGEPTACRYNVGAWLCRQHLALMAHDGNSPFVKDSLQGKVALITGGGSGIGFEIARQLGLHGASIIVSGRRQAVLEAACNKLAADGIKAAPAQADVRKLEDCSRAVEHARTTFGGLHILVNCAAGNFLAPAEVLTPNGFRTGGPLTHHLLHVRAAGRAPAQVTWLLQPSSAAFCSSNTAGNNQVLFIS